MNDGRFDVLDVISVASFFLGYQNLQENREQSAHNNVSAANDKQASYLLSELGKRLDRQDRTLEDIVEKLERLEGRANSDTV